MVLQSITAVWALDDVCITSSMIIKEISAGRSIPDLGSLDSASAA